MAVTVVAGTTGAPAGSAGAAPDASAVLALARTLADPLGARVLPVRVEVVRRRRGARRAAPQPGAPPAGTAVVGASSVCGGLREAAEREGAVLVVVGATHRTGLDRHSREAGGERLLGGCRRALAFAPQQWDPDQAGGIHVIGVGFDGDGESADAARAAAALARRTGATLRVHAFTAPTPASLEPPPIGASAKERLERKLGRLLDELPAEVRPFGQVSIGEPVAGLLELAEGADLLVLGSHGRSALERAIFGSVAPQVVHAARVPVLAFPPGSAGAFIDALAAAPERAAA